MILKQLRSQIKSLPFWSRIEIYHIQNIRTRMKNMSHFQMEFTLVYNLIQYSLLSLILICTIVLIKDRFFPDIAIFDLLFLPPKHSMKINCSIEEGNKEFEQVSSAAIFDSPSTKLSVIFSIQNDEQTLPRILEDLVNALQQRKMNDPDFSWEMIIVDNCSTDNSTNIVLGYMHTTEGIKLIRLQKILGFFAASQIGAINATGNIIVLSELHTLESNFTEEMIKQIQETFIQNKPILLFGNREMNENESNSNKIPFWLNAMNSTFKFFNAFTGINAVLDPLCPFAVFSRKTAQWIIPNLHLSNNIGFAEIISIAQIKRYQINEINIKQNNESFKDFSFGDFTESFGEILKLIVGYRIKVWSIRLKGHISNQIEEV